MRALELIVGLAIGALVLAFLLLQVALGSGFVREHCLDLEASRSARALEVDSRWAFILWPPAYFESLDTGACVRNPVVREVAAELGIWELPPAEEQVRRRVAEQIAAEDR
jgi:hypothetical protein